MKNIFKIIFLFIVVFFIGIIFCFSAKSVINYIPKIANILTFEQIDYKLKKTSKKEFFGKVKKEKIGQFVKVLRKNGYKNYYSSFLSNSGMFLKYNKQTKQEKTSKKDFSGSLEITGNQSVYFFENLGNISVSKDVLDYFIGKDFKDIDKEEWEALAFYLGLKKQYSGKYIGIQEQFKHYRQKLSLSCEANTLTDFVNYYRVKYGVNSVSEYRLIGQIPMDKRKFKIKDGKYFRGDPDVGFVGNMNGYAFRLDLKYSFKRGRGVYPKPLLKILNYYLGKFNLKPIEKNKLTELDIISSLAVKNPIMMRYIYDGQITPLKITTSQDREITLYKNQHVGLIVGAKLDDNINILGIFYYDGLHSKKQFMKYDIFKKWTKQMSKFIVVR